MVKARNTYPLKKFLDKIERSDYSLEKSHIVSGYWKIVIDVLYSESYRCPIRDFLTCFLCFVGGWQ